MTKLLTIASLISLVFFLKPLFKPGLIAGHDTGARIIHTQMLANALKEGQFPVRVVEGPKPGLSHPLFNYYPPGYYYFPATLTLLYIPIVTSTYLALALFTVLGWVGMYLLVNKLLGSIPAAISACLFIFTPYHISQLYVRAAYLEFAATALIPFAFLGIYQIFHHQKISGLIFTSLSLASIIYTHQPSFIMIMPAILVWAFGLIIETRGQKNLPYFIVGMILAITLSASFLLPQIFESSLIRSSGLSSNYYDFRKHFASIGQLIYSVWGYGISVPGLSDGMSFQVGVLNWLALLGAAIHAIYSQLYQKKSNIFLPVIFILITIYAVFMACPISLPIWERVSLLSYLQYPWRFLAITTFATSVLAGYLATIILPRYAFIPIIICVLFNWQYTNPASYLSTNYFDFNSPSLPQTDPMFGLESSYFPRSVAQIDSSQDIPRFKLATGDATIEPVLDTAANLSFNATVKTLSTISINSHYFPGWIAKINSANNQYIVKPGQDDKTGNMEITLLPGQYQVELHFDNTPIRTISNYLTLLSISIIILLIINKYYQFYEI